MRKKTYFTAEEIAAGVYRITDVSMTRMYLVVGTEKAAVLDTGVGYGDLYAFVRTITEKPLIVLISHGHLDHAMGADTFPGEVYMNLRDIPVYEKHRDVKKRYEFSKGMNFMRGIKAITEPLRMAEFHLGLAPTAFLPLVPGDTFDLGGEVIEVCQGSGHTPGTVTFLLQKHRLLMTGDACNTGVYLFDEDSTSVELYRSSMEMLKHQTQGLYDKILLCHGLDSNRRPEHSTLQPIGLIEGAIWICDAILDGRDDHVPVKNMGQIGYSAKGGNLTKRNDIGDHSRCNIIYNDKKLKMTESEAAELNGVPYNR